MEDTLLYSLNEMVTGKVYQHIENNLHYRLHEGELQVFHLGCWNDNKQGIITITKKFTIAENWNEEGIYKGEGINIKTELEKEGLKIVDFAQRKSEKEKSGKYGMAPLGKYDFVFEDKNIYLEAFYCPEGDVHLSYHCFLSMEQMGPMLPDHIKMVIQKFKQEMPYIKEYRFKQTLEETEIGLNKWDKFLNRFPWINITLEKKVEAHLEPFKKHQQKKIQKFQDNLDSTKRLNNLIKGK